MNEEVLQNRELSTGSTFQVYFPDEMNENTKIILYEHGTDGYKTCYTQINQHLSEAGSNAIIIEYERFDNVDQIEILKMVSEETGVPIINYESVAHSYGLEPAITTKARVIQENPNMTPSSVISLDGALYLIRDPDILNTLGSSNTTVFGFEGQNIIGDFYNHWVTDYKVNLVRIKGNYNCWGAELHTRINKNYVDKKLLEFQSGEGIFPYEYTTEIFDGQSWIEIDIGGMTLEESEAHIYLHYENIYPSKYNVDNINLLSSLGTINNVNGIVSLSNLSNTDLSVLSDSDLLAHCINQLSSSIKSTKLVQSPPKFSNNYNGNTKVPTEILFYINPYISSTTDLLFKLANDLNSIAKIGYSIELMDQNIKNETENINITSL